MNTITAIKIADKLELNPRERVVFQKLADRSNKNNLCWPGLKRIAADTKMSVSTVQRALRTLISLGLVLKKPNFRENGSQTTNIYILSENLNCLEEVKEENRRIQKKIEERTERLQKKKKLAAAFKAVTEGQENTEATKAMKLDGFIKNKLRGMRLKINIKNVPAKIKDMCGIKETLTRLFFNFLFGGSHEKQPRT